jgi:hypothetical protein
MHAQRIPWKWWHRRDWILGFHRDTIAKHNSIGAGAVSSIVANYKFGPEAVWHFTACKINDKSLPVLVLQESAV